jgi:pyruvate/2-oxoglutarate dehydrogenase complex dihydrolipoamide dehydrogenase (E3) component
MGDTFAVMGSLQQRNPKTAAIIGAGYIGLEMAEALTLRGIAVTQIEDQHSAQLLGAQLVGHRNAEIAKRVDT